MASEREREEAAAWQIIFRRKVMFILVIGAVALLGFLFVRWINSDSKLGKVRDIYHQADEINP